MSRRRRDPDLTVRLLAVCVVAGAAALVLALLVAHPPARCGRPAPATTVCRTGGCS